MKFMTYGIELRTWSIDTVAGSGGIRILKRRSGKSLWFTRRSLKMCRMSLFGEGETR